jgi:hypothetical protein
METLLNDYRRRLTTIQNEIDKLKYNCPSDLNYIRYKTKASCYRTFIVEIERELAKKNV